ncbi:MAG: peptidoglycan DD-metalloendopeptidase family protein [Woeseiaceae bacterium]|nr:peptidoglycan DD-metalloendopeptidase family protein [Woeseiaceae bacterium]
MSSSPEARVAERLARHGAGEPVVDSAPRVQTYLGSTSLSPAPVIESDGRSIVLDLGAGSRALGTDLDNIDVGRFTSLIEDAMRNAASSIAFGRWGEQRNLYRNEHFAGASGESRTVHMGIDAFCAAGTPVNAPLAGVVEIIANNTQELDYGPMVILKHRSPDGDSFFTLYGHLDLASTRQLRMGQTVQPGDTIAAIGRPPENGNWPPHLHFQLIHDLLGMGADFPGVAPASQRDFWLAMSPLPAVFFPEVDRDELDAAVVQTL